MATFEEMQFAWTAQSAKLDQVTGQLADIVRLKDISRIRKPLRGLMVSLGLEIALCATGMVVMGSFLADHFGDLRFVWPPAVIDFWLIATLIFATRQMVFAASVNYEGSISAVQEKLAAIRILRLKTFRWTFLSGQIVWWIPFLITALRMFFGVDAYKYFSRMFLVANMLTGVALIPMLLFAAKRAPGGQESSWFKRLADVIAGHSLTEAQQQAGAIADFQNE